MRLLAGLLAVALVTACAGPRSSGSPPATSSAAPTSPNPAASAAPGGELILLTHDAFALSEDVLRSFETEHGVTVRVLKAGDAGAMVNQAILSKEHPLGDVLYGIDNTFLSRALASDLFEPYQAPALGSVGQALRLDPEFRVTPIDYGDVCLNLDRAAFTRGAPVAPQKLEDLTNPAYRGMLVVENPATSSPGLAFMLATIARFGESGSYTWLDYWKDLRANDVKVSASWNDAYETEFSAGSGKGDRPIVVSYASSPPAAVYFASSPPPEAPTEAVLDGCFRQVEFAGVLAGTKQPEFARAFVDFMLSPKVQQDIPLQMFVFPAVTGTPLPDVFKRFAKVPDEPLTVAPDTIAANRERWIQEWTATVLR